MHRWLVQAVLSAAIRCQSGVIVTYNLGDFPQTAEVIAACGESCGSCLKRDIVGDAPPGTKDRKKMRPEPAEAIPDERLFERLRALRKKLEEYGDSFLAEILREH